MSDMQTAKRYEGGSMVCIYVKLKHSIQQNFPALDEVDMEREKAGALWCFVSASRPACETPSQIR